MRLLRWLADKLFEKTDGPWIRTGKSIVMTLTILFLAFGMFVWISGDGDGAGKGISYAIGRLLTLPLTGGR
ncbi:MAG: hypothetical protein AAFV19_06010 [Pseudomonadota bacterium]